MRFVVHWNIVFYILLIQFSIHINASNNLDSLKEVINQHVDSYNSYKASLYIDSILLNLDQYSEKEIIDVKIFAAEFYRKHHNFLKAKSILNSIEKNVNTVQDVSLKVRFLNRKTAIYQEGGFATDSIQLFLTKSINLAKDLQDSALISTCFNDQGFHYENNSRFELALNSYQFSLQFLPNTNFDSINYYNIHVNISRTLLKAEKYKTIIQRIPEIIQPIQDNPKYSYELTYFYEALSGAFLRLNQFEKALLYRNAYFIWYEQNFRKEINQEYFDLNSKFQKELDAEKIVQLELEKRAEKSKANKRLIIICISIGVLVLSFILIYKYQQTSKRFKELYSEKDLLLKETNHRIHNSLQNLQALMDLQLQFSQSNEEKKAIQSSMERIHAVAMTNQMLEANNSSEYINTKTFLSVLIQKIQAQYIDSNIDIHYSIDSLQLPYQKIFSLSIMLSELITNSVKHVKKNKIEINLKLLSTQKGLKFQYRDNGEEIIESPKQSFGLQLIESCIQQLKGNIKSYTRNRLNFDF